MKIIEQRVHYCKCCGHMCTSEHDTTFTKYMCELCNSEYATENEARECEKKPLTNFLGLQIGDIVQVSNSVTPRQHAIITRIEIYGQNEYVERFRVKTLKQFVDSKYWHTPHYCVMLLRDEHLVSYLDISNITLIDKDEQQKIREQYGIT